MTQSTSTIRGLSCALVGCTGILVLLGAASAGYYLTMRNLQPVPEAKTQKPRAEVIKYKPVKDNPIGPSVVTPSGRSGLTVKVPQGVIRTKSKDVVRSGKIKLPSKKSVCRDKKRLSDIVKRVAFDVDRQMREQTPLSVDEELDLGDRLDREVRNHPQFKGKVDGRKTRKWRAYLARVAQPLLAEIERRDIPYHFHVIDDPTVNAFAIPGGHIYFFTGLLENKGGAWIKTEADLAGILAHEISHVDMGHCAAVFEYLKAIGVTGKEAISASVILTLARGAFSSNQEDEADINATEIMIRAQYDPGSFAKMWQRWAKLQGDDGQKRTSDGLEGLINDELENLLRSHSEPRKRACTVSTQARDSLKAAPFNRYYIGRKNFKRRKPRVKKQY